MRYVIVDMEGASREYFSRREDVRAALRELEAEQPGIAGDLLVLTYDDEGHLIGEPESAVDVLTLVFFPLVGQSANRLLITDLWTGGLSGVATMASGQAWPVTAPSMLAPVHPYQYESEAAGLSGAGQLS